MRIKKVQSILETNRVTITASEIRKAFRLPDNAEVFVRVPGGADWSNVDLEITEQDCLLEAKWEIKTIKELPSQFFCCACIVLSMSVEEREKLTQTAYDLLTECEDDAVQQHLNDWERNFLNSNLERKEKNLPIYSEKVINILRRIAGYKHGKEPTSQRSGSRRYEGFSRG